MIGGKKYSAVVVKNNNGVYEVNVTVGEQDDNSTNSSIGSEEVDKPTPFSYGRDRKIEEKKNQPINTTKKSQIKPGMDGENDDGDGSDKSYDSERLGYDFDGTPYPTEESVRKEGKGGRTKRKRKSERRIIKKITRRRKGIKTKGTRKRS